MSVLEDIGSGSESARSSLEDALSLVRRAYEEAGELEDSASGHGWAGVAEAMGNAREALESTVQVVEDAYEATGTAIERLGEITSEMSSDEVARRLGEIGEGLDSARTGAGRAVELLDDVRTAAGQADAETLLQLADSAEEHLQSARESLESTVKDTESEASDATTWGN